MDYEAFFELCRSMPDADAKWVESFIGSIGGLFDDEKFQDIGRACTLFYGRGSGISKAQFYRKRRFIIEFYSWLLKEGKISRSFFDSVASLKIDDVVSEQELSIYYFKDLDSALGFIRLVGGRRGLSDDKDLLAIKTIVVLSWHGVNVHEMVDIRKADVDVVKDTILIHGIDERTIRLEEKYFRIIREFVSNDVHRGFPSQKTQAYVPSKYLFRSARQDHMSENNINCCLKRFNEDAKDLGHIFGLIALKKNGLFCDIVSKDDGKRSINSLFSDVCKDRQMAFGYAKFYSRWKQYYYQSTE